MKYIIFSVLCFRLINQKEFFKCVISSWKQFDFDKIQIEHKFVSGHVCLWQIF
jgi:hypothetical protein